MPCGTLISIFLFIRHGARTPSLRESPDTTGIWNCGNRAIEPPHRIPVVNGTPRFLGFNASTPPDFPPTCRDGGLLDIGFDQLVALGAAYREYLTGAIRFLPPAFDPALVSVKASHLGRAVESAVGFMHGLYPPETDGEVLQVEQTGVSGADPLVPGEAEAKALVSGGVTGFFNTPVFQKRADETKQILKPLLDSLNSSDVPPFRILTTGDFVIARHCSGNSYPSVVTEEMYERMASDLDFVIGECYHRVVDSVFPPLVRFIFTGIDDWYAQKSRVQFTLLSGHDITLVAFLEGLAAGLEVTSPPYASHVAVELWHLDRPHIRVSLNGEVLLLVPLSEFRRRFAA
jgi:acid phosphatase